MLLPTRHAASEALLLTDDLRRLLAQNRRAAVVDPEPVSRRRAPQVEAGQRLREREGARALRPVRVVAAVAIVIGLALIRLS